MQKLSFEEFETKARAIHGDEYGYSSEHYTHRMGETRIHHRACDRYFIQSANNHIGSNRTGCSYCFGTPRKTTQQVIEEFKVAHGDQYDYSRVNYRTAFGKVEIIHKACGQSFWQMPKKHLAKHGCPFCCKNNRLKTAKQFAEDAKAVHGDRYDYSKVVYINAKTKVQIGCRKCGNTFRQTPNSHLRPIGCPFCQNYRQQESWLDSLGVPKDQRQVTVSLNSGRKVRVDAYDPVANVVYEYWGDFWHGNPTTKNQDEVNPITNTTFGSLFEQTTDKRQAIIDSGLTLIEIWESEWKELK